MRVHRAEKGAHSRFTHGAREIPYQQHKRRTTLSDCICALAVPCIIAVVLHIINISN